ncbi:MAG: PepSY domain-containing protein [Sphingomonadales bacterium]
MEGKTVVTLNLHKFSGLVHKWLGLLIGIQVVLWVVGGLVMSWFELERVRGEHNIREVEAAPIDPAAGLKPVAEIIAAASEPVASVALKRLGGRLVYDLTGAADDQHSLVDALSGELLSPLPAETALALAVADFAGTSSPSRPEFIEAHNLEYRGALPVWRVVMNDEEGTRLYVSPATGRVLARRNAVWRIYDFFWMLHIMDYENRTDFNNPLLVFFSITAILFSLTGIVLIFYRFKRRDFAWLRGKS